VAEEVTAPRLADATPTVLKLKRANPDFVLTQGYALSAEPLLVKTAREYGLNATFTGTYYSSEVVLLKRAFYMGALFVVLTVAEAYRRAAEAGELTRAGVVNALENLEGYDAMGLTYSTKFVNHRLPYTKIYRASIEKKAFVPITDWLKLV